MIDVVLNASLKLPGRFSMLAVVGAPLEKVLPLCQPGEAELAAVMLPSQFLIAGREQAVQTLAGAVDSLALKVTTLSLRWPLHTSLMVPVAEELERSRARLGRLRRFRLPVYSALHGGRIETPEEGWQLLVEHLYRPQRFDLAFQAAWRDGLRHCIEFGPGGSMERAVRWTGHDQVEVEVFPEVAARRRRSLPWR
jgi:acyl transferase domain-containing protein